MNILNDKQNINSFTKSDTEIVEQEKQEYYLLGSFIRTRGLTLFGFNYLKNEIFEIKIQQGSTIHLVPIDGKLIPIDMQIEKCMVDSRFDYFECLNMYSAINRVKNIKKVK